MGDDSNALNVLFIEGLWSEYLEVISLFKLDAPVVRYGVEELSLSEVFDSLLPEIEVEVCLYLRTKDIYPEERGFVVGAEDEVEEVDDDRSNHAV